MISANKPRWQQVTALVSLSASGTITGFSFVPNAHTDLTSPASMPIRLMALERSATAAPADDSMLRSAIVNVANYYLRMAQGKTPAEMEAIIWQHDSIDGVDHGESCAAFASLTLELAAQVVGQQSWVTGGTSYPWPLHKWADVRVDPNPDSPDIISVLQDAQAHGRWHPLGDGYQPQPGDWVLFDGHVEVVTKYAGGVLYTIGGDSLPNFSVNAHEYSAPLDAQGVVGFVNNGDLAPAPSPAAPGGGQARDQAPPAIPATAAAIPGEPAAGAAQPVTAQQVSNAAIPGMPTAAAAAGPSGQAGPAPAPAGPLARRTRRSAGRRRDVGHRGGARHGRLRLRGSGRHGRRGRGGRRGHPGSAEYRAEPRRTHGTVGHSVRQAPARGQRGASAGDELAAGFHQRDRTGSHGHPAPVRRAGRGHHRPGHR